RGAAYRDAFALQKAPERVYTEGGSARRIRGGRNHLDGKFSQICSRPSSKDGAAHGVSRRIAVGRQGVGFRTEPLVGSIKHQVGQRASRSLPGVQTTVFL